MIPRQVLGLIGDTPMAVLPGIPTDRYQCEGAKFHSPRPMTVHPFSMQASDGEIVYLCGTCMDNVRLLLSLLENREGDVAWPIKRYFGNLARNVADKAYAQQQREQQNA